MILLFQPSNFHYILPFDQPSSIILATSLPHFLHFPLRTMPNLSLCIEKSTIVVTPHTEQKTLLKSRSCINLGILLHLCAALKSITDTNYASSRFFHTYNFTSIPSRKFLPSLTHFSISTKTFDPRGRKNRLNRSSGDFNPHLFNLPNLANRNDSRLLLVY